MSRLNFNDFINHFGDSMLKRHTPKELAEDTEGNMHIFKQGGCCDYCKVFIKFDKTKYAQCGHCGNLNEVKDGI